MSDAGFLQAAATAGEQGARGGLTDIQLDELRLRPVLTADELARIRPLRHQIALPTEVLNDSRFLALEKKETSWASLPHLSWAASR